MPRIKPISEGLIFQLRDFALLRGLFESRVMTAAYIPALRFDGKKEATNKQFQKIFATSLS